MSRLVRCFSSCSLLTGTVFSYTLTRKICPIYDNIKSNSSFTTENEELTWKYARYDERTWRLGKKNHRERKDNTWAKYQRCIETRDPPLSAFVSSPVSWLSCYVSHTQELGGALTLAFYETCKFGWNLQLVHARANIHAKCRRRWCANSHSVKDCSASFGQENKPGSFGWSSEPAAHALIKRSKNATRSPATNIFKQLQRGCSAGCIKQHSTVVDSHSEILPVETSQYCNCTIAAMHAEGNT